MKLITVVGARPQFVKAAAVSRAVRRSGTGIEEVIVHTGQHYDTRMSDLFFSELVIPEPRYHLDIGSGAHGAQTGAMLASVEHVLTDERPDAVLVYGDTNSTLAGALAAVKMHIPVVHVEAGLRSHNRRMPEEINRVVTDHVSSLLLCPSDVAVAHLLAEGVVEGVERVGDVMYDILLATQADLAGDNPVARALGLADNDYVVVTLHRAENTDDPARFEAFLDGLCRVASARHPVVWPVHPRLKDRLGHRSMPASLHLVEPASYREMLGLLAGAAVVCTDSGGLQKEAMWSGSPCVTLRDETEWTETVDEGWNRLVGPDPEAVERAVATATRPAGAPSAVYGDGDAADRIVVALQRFA